MARQPLMGSGVGGPPAIAPTERYGYLPGYSLEMPKEIRPQDKFFYEKLRNSAPRGALIQEELTEDYGAPGALPTPPLFGGDNSTYPLNGQVYPQSTVTRATVYNRIQMLEETWSVPRINERFASLGGIAGGIKSEVSVEISKATKRLAQKRERILLSNQAGVTQNGSTPQRGAGFFSLMTVNSGNVNIDAAGGQPTDITAINRDQLNALCLALYKAGGGTERFVYMPPEVLLAWAQGFQPLPGHMIIDSDPSDETLNLVLKKMNSPVGIDLMFVSHRVMTTQGIAVVNHDENGMSKRIIEPFGVYHWLDGRRDKDGWVDETLALMPGQAPSSGGWFTSTVIDANGGA